MITWGSEEAYCTKSHPCRLNEGTVWVGMMKNPWGQIWSLTSCLVGGNGQKRNFLRAIFVGKSIEKSLGQVGGIILSERNGCWSFRIAPFDIVFFCSLGCLWQLLRLVVSYIPETVVWWLRIAACLFEADMILISLLIMVADWEKMLQFHKESLLIIHYSYWGAEGRIQG